LAKANMSGKDTSRANDSNSMKDFIIPELESAPCSRKPWSDDEERVIAKYYGKRPTMFIKRYIDQNFPPGRSLASIYKKARMMCVGDE